MSKLRLSWGCKDTFWLGVLLLGVGGALCLVWLLFYAIGMAEHVAETRVGSFHVDEVPPGKSHFMAWAVLCGSLAALGGALAVGAKLWQWVRRPPDRR